MTVTKSGRTVWEQSLWTSGRRSEKWFLEGVQFQILPGSADMALVPRPDTNANDQSYFDYSDADFPELKGLSLQHYKGVQSHEGKPAYAFAWERGGESMTVLLSETQLPLLLTRKVGNHTITQTYAFAAGAPARLAVPERLRKLLQAHKRGLQALSRTPSPP
ncbi:hypothetical protein DB346_07285 [Verrucomicrobia bacterium LW23]|nr:hypothetical protein DB346_07285 [Verrucomicrobia bacterium LW23]